MRVEPNANLQAVPAWELQERRAYGQPEQKPEHAAPDEGVPQPDGGQGAFGTSRLLHRLGSIALLLAVVVVGLVQLAWVVFLASALVSLLKFLL